MAAVIDSFIYGYLAAIGIVVLAMFVRRTGGR